MRKFLLVCLLLCISFYSQARENPKASDWLSNSVSFTENKGQVIDTKGDHRPDILFTSEVNGTKLYFRKDAVSYVFSKVETDARTQVAELKGLYRMDLEFIGANPNVQVISEVELGAVNNYYNANRPVLGVKNYGKITYKNIYNNIDLVFYPGKQGGMKYDFVVRSGGKVSDIRLRHKAADKVSLNKGALAVANSFGSVNEDAPYTFTQTASGAQGRLVASQYILKDGIVTFGVGNYNSNETLVIDPFVTVASTYYGSTNLDQAFGVARDGSGNVTITGYTQNSSFPVSVGAHQGSFGGSNDAFLVQFGPSGARNWATFYGGSSIDQGNDIAADGSGNLYVTGVTASQSGISTPGTYQPNWNGGSDAFIAKFTSNGLRSWGSYYGQGQVDQGLGVAVAANGDVYFGGVTYSNGFPGFAGARDGFLAKFNSSDGSRVWGRLYGGAGIDIINKVDVDANNSTVVVAGQTSSTSGISTMQGDDYNGGSDDMFVATFDASNGSTKWGMYGGGTGSDIAYSVDVDGSGNIYVVGSTTGSNGLASAGAFQTSNDGGEDAFVAKVSASGTVLWSTYLGGSQIDRALDVATNSAGEVFVSGLTFSTNFDVKDGAIQSTSGGNSDAFVARFDGNGGNLCSSTYYGGSGSDIARSIAVSGSNVVFAGQSISTNYPVANAAQGSRGGNDDAVVTWLTVSGTCASSSGCQNPVSVSGTTTNSGCSSDNGSVSITANGGSGNFSYRWSNGSTNRNLSNVSAGTYVVTVTDNNNAQCVGTGNFTVVSDGISANINAGQGTISVNITKGQSPYNVSIDGGSATQQTSNNFTLSASAGTHTVVIVDANGCIISQIIDVPNPNTGFTIQEAGNDPSKLTFCEDGSVTMNVVNPQNVAYQWMLNGASIAGANGPTYTITEPAKLSQEGRYTVRNLSTGDMSNGLDVIIYPNPDVTTSPMGNAVICSGAGFASLCAIQQPNVLYTWYGATGILQGPSSNPCFNATGNGTYFVNLRNFITGCEEISMPINVTSAPGPAAPTVTAGGNTSLCAGSAVSLTRSNEGGFTYEWRRNGQTLGTFGITLTVSEDGVYDIVAKSASGCVAFSNGVSVSVKPSPSASITATGGTSFCTEGSITTVLTAQSGAGNTYQWTRNGSVVSTTGSNVFNVRTAGVYGVIITNTSNCSSVSNTVTVDVNALAETSISATGRTNFCIGENVNVLLTATASSNTTYQWFINGSPLGGSTTNNSIIVNQAGRYSVQTTSGVCNSTSNEILITVAPKPTASITIDAPGDNTVCEDGFVDLIANSGPEFMYQWYRNGVAIGGASTRAYRVTEVGVFNYSVSVGRFGCMSDESNPQEVTIYPKPTGGIKTKNNSTSLCIGQSMMLDATEDLNNPNSNNPAELSYTWRFNGAVIPTANMPIYMAENPGIYQVRILNGKTGCERISDINLRLVNPPVVTITIAGQPTTFCEGGMVTLTANPDGDDYRWFRDGVIIAGANDRTYMATMTGEYRAEVTVGACAVVSQGVNVNVTPLPNADITIDGATDFCSNANNTVLRAQPGADSYQWLMAASANDMPMAIPGATMETLAITKKGLYWVIVMKDGCVDTTSTPVDVSVRLAPSARIQANGNLTQCAGSNALTFVALPPGAMLTYQWFVGETPQTATPISGANDAEFTPSFTGKYWVQITNTRNCSSLSEAVFAKFNPIPKVTISLVPDSIVCQDGSVEMRAMASGAEPNVPYSYQWYMGNDPIQGANNATYFATATGDYFVIVTAANCSSSPSNPLHAKVHPNPDITISLSGLNHPCDGVTLNAIELPNYNYQWLFNGAIIAGANSPSYTTDMPGNYNVTIRNFITGCEETSIAVTVHPNPVADAGQSIAICAGVTGSLNGSATGGNGVYNYMWTEPAGLSGTLSDPTDATPSVTIANAGTYVYTLNVTDGRGCISAPPAFVTVVVNPNPVANAGGDQIVCSGTAFNLTGSASSGDGSYQYMWTGPNGFTASTSTVSNLTIEDAGTYNFTLTVMDGNGCIGSDEVSVEIKPEPGIRAIEFNNVTLTGADQMSPKSFCFGNKLVIESTVAGDFFAWYRGTEFVQGGIDNKYTVFVTGEYTLIVTHNVAGIQCTSSVPFSVTVFPEPVAEIFPVASTVICPGGLGLTAVSAPGYKYQWLMGLTPATAVAIPNATSANYTATMAGRYWVLTTTSLGDCQKLSNPIDLTQSTLVVNNVTIGGTSRCGSNDGSIVARGTSSNFPVLYSLNGGSENSNGVFAGLGTGSYKVTIREVGGCTVDSMVNVTVMAPMGLTVSANTITANSAIASWDAIMAGTGTTKYNLRFRVVGAETWTNIRNISLTSQALAGLQHDTNYEVEVQTVCSDPANNSPWARTTFNTLANGTSCETPSDIYVNIMRAPNMIPTVYWQNVSNAACYDLQYRTVTPLGEWVSLQVNGAQNPFPIAGLQAATTYQVRMRAHCTFCNSTNRSEWSPNVPFTTPGVCNPNASFSINNGVNVVNNCGDYTLRFDGQVLPNYSFQWRLNGQEIGDATDTELMVSESGDYDLAVTVGNCETVYSNAVDVTVKAIPQVIANVVQSVSCISGADGVIKAGCVDTDRIICNQSATDYLYRLIGPGYDSGFQPSGIFPGLKSGQYTAIILDQATGCTDSYTNSEFTTIKSPDKADFVAAVGINTFEGSLKWNSVFGANAYMLSYRPKGSFEQNWTDVMFNGGCPFPGTCDFVLSGLQNGTSYEVRIQTRCAQGNVWSNWTDTTNFFTASFTGCPDEQQSVPGGIFAYVYEDSASVYWNRVPNAVTYQLRYRQTGQDEANSIVLPETNGTFAKISNLIPNTSYSYEVRSICGSNVAGDYSDTRTFKTLFFKNAEVVENNSEVSVYPNPNNGRFTINFTSTVAGTATMKLYDITGKLVMSQNQNVSTGSVELPVEMNGYAAGVYMLHFNQGSISKVVKVVIN